MKEWLCGLLFGHPDEHGEIDPVTREWTWRCLRCGRRETGGLSKGRG